MIEVDLLPGGRASGKNIASRNSVAPRPLRILLQDPWILVSGAVIILSVALSAGLLVSGRGRAAGMADAIDSAIRDSTGTAASAGEVGSIESRLDSASARVAMIRDLDAERYIWPRLFDELARTLPEEAWLVQVAQIPALDGRTRFRVEGQTLDNAALSRFWDGMESSDFIRNVRLVSTEHATGPAGDPQGLRTTYFFVLEGEYHGAPRAVTRVSPSEPIAG